MMLCCKFIYFLLVLIYFLLMFVVLDKLICTLMLSNIIIYTYENIFISCKNVL